MGAALAKLVAGAPGFDELEAVGQAVDDFAFGRKRVALLHVSVALDGADDGLGPAAALRNIGDLAAAFAEGVPDVRQAYAARSVALQRHRQPPLEDVKIADFSGEQSVEHDVERLRVLHHL